MKRILKDTIRAEAVLVYGQQGCGKTRDAEMLAAILGKTRVVDGVPFYSDDQARAFLDRQRSNTLVLTQYDCEGLETYYEVIAFEDIKPYLDAVRAAADSTRRP
jgi:Mg-chelatase subunit ChlI